MEKNFNKNRYIYFNDNPKLEGENNDLLFEDLQNKLSIKQFLCRKN